MEEVVVGVAVAGGGRIGGPDGADGRGVPTGDGGGGPFGLDRRTGGPQSSSGELLLLASEMSLLSDGQLARLARLLGVRVLALRLRLLSRSEPACTPPLTLNEGVVPSAGHTAPWADLLPPFVMEEGAAAWRPLARRGVFLLQTLWLARAFHLSMPRTLLSPRQGGDCTCQLKLLKHLCLPKPGGDALGFRA